MRVTIFLCWSFVLLSHIKCIRMVVDADSLNDRFQASNLDIRLSGMSLDLPFAWSSVMGAKAGNGQWLLTGTLVSAWSAVIPTDDFRPHSSIWGYGPCGVLRLLVVIIIALLLMERLYLNLPRVTRSAWSAKTMWRVAWRAVLHSHWWRSSRRSASVTFDVIAVGNQLHTEARKGLRLHQCK